jgi:O-antigen ligase
MLKRLLLAALIFDVPFHTDVNFGRIEYDAQLNAISGLEMSLTTVCLAALYFLWFVELALSHRGLPVLRRGAERSLAIYVLVAFVSVAVAYDAALARNELWLLLQTFLVYVYVVNQVRSEQDVQFLLKMLLLSALAQAVLIIGLSLRGSDLIIGPYWARVEPRSMRIGGTVGSPNTAGAYLAFVIAPCLAFLQIAANRRQVLLGLLTGLLSFVALLLTLSRGGWAGAIASLIIYFAVAWHRRWVSWKLPMGIAVSALVVFAIFHRPILERLTGDDLGSAEARVPLMMLAIRMFTDHPLLGVGANNFIAAMDPYVTYPDFSGAWVHVVHNKYLLVLAETGIIGLMAYLAFLMATVRSGMTCCHLPSLTMSPIALGLTAGVVGQMVHMCVDLFHDRPPVQLLWLIAGLIAAMDGHLRDPVQTMTPPSPVYHLA